MITTRSLLRERNTAAWIERKRQRSRRRALKRRSFRARRALSFRGSWLARTLYPSRLAPLIAPRSRRIDPFWQTTRVFPGGALRSALNRPRASGTAPPAAGLTDVSAAGSGQYEALSMCADAVVTATTIAAVSTATTSIAERYPCMAEDFT